MAHRPTNPSPYFERVDATGDIDLKFRIADHDVVTSAKVIVRSNNLSGYSFPIVCALELSAGKLTVTNQTESFKSDGSSLVSLSKNFLSVSGVRVNGLSTTSYTYNAESNSILFSEAPSAGATVIVIGSISVSGDWQGEIKGGNGDYSFVNMKIPAGTLENGKDYKWKIDQLNGTAVDNREFFFSTKRLPTVAVTEPSGDKITSVSANFSGSCDDDVEYYRWEIRDEDGSLIFGTENIYNSNLTCSYSGFFSGDSVTAYLYVKVKMRQEELSANKTYSVEYAVYGNPITVKTSNDSYHNRVEIDFTGLSYVGGRASSDRYSLSNGILHLDDGEYVTWDNRDGTDLVIPGGTGYSLKFKLDVGFCGTIMEINDASGAFKFGYDGAFWYEINGVREAVDMSAWFSKASMFQPSGSSDNDKIYTFGVADTIDFSSAGTVIKIADGTFAYWWYLKYYNNQVSITKGGAVSGT